jgi:hypothetical protein
MIKSSHETLTKEVCITTGNDYTLKYIECDDHHPTGYYAYLWFALQEARDDVLSNRHKLVTLAEIV